jgi:hypothetical protein
MRSPLSLTLGSFRGNASSKMFSSLVSQVWLWQVLGIDFFGHILHRIFLASGIKRFVSFVKSEFYHYFFWYFFRLYCFCLKGQMASPTDPSLWAGQEIDQLVLTFSCCRQTRPASGALVIKLRSGVPPGLCWILLPQSFGQEKQSFLGMFLCFNLCLL